MEVKVERKRKLCYRVCPVKDCGSDPKTSDIKFFLFPKDKKKSNSHFSPLAKLWSIFTRHPNFTPVCSEALCEKHFSDDCFVYTKKGKTVLKTKSVPTIYYDSNGQRVVVEYDPSREQYYGYEAEKILQEIDSSTQLEEQDIVNSRLNRMKEIKNLCTFCFANGKDVKCVAMSKLESFSIDPMEIVNILGIDLKYGEVFNEIICPNCFERILDFENYRKRCRKAQQEIILEMEEIDRKIARVRNSQRYKQSTATPENWFQIKVIAEESDVVESDVEDFANDNDVDSDFNDFNDDSQKSICEIVIKNEPIEESFVQPETHTKKRKISNDDETINEKKIKLELAENVATVVKSSKKDKNRPMKEAPPKKGSDKRIYECFFCRVKYSGLKTFKTHNCSVKRVKCEVPTCESYFINQGGYNQHLQRRHGLPKVSKRYCPACRTVYQMNAIMFDEHCQKCLLENEYKEQPIQCDQCKKICDNLQSYTAHKMFHDTKDLPATIIDESGMIAAVKMPKSKSRSKESHMCDLCGKVFDNSGLRRHKTNVHFVDFTGEMFFCDLCPLAKPTKRLLYNHMKSTHIVRPHSCDICGKVFRNRELWRKHQLVHGDYKKNNRCDVCPHKPGFVTKAALKKHMANNHGGTQPVRNFFCNICGAAYSRDDQLTRHRVSVHQIFHNNYTPDIINQYVKI